MASSAAITGVSVIAVAAPAHASTAGSAHVRITPAAREMVRTAIRKAARPVVTVAPGDTLSGIARAHCGSGASWRAIYDANRSTVKNPDLIYPGQVLVLNCSSAHLSSVHAPPADRFDGKKGPCGDGDHDGFDAQCWEVGLAPAPGHHASRGITRITVRPVSFSRHHAAVSRHAAVAAFSASGTYSFAGLENLWVSAGGPAWAERAAAAVAECESGGRASAFNPSGASGLWQILGEVVPGNVFNPMVNAENAVAKFKASGDTWSQWVCKP